MRLFFALGLLIISSFFAYSQHASIPKSYSNIFRDENGKLYFKKETERYYADTLPPRFTIQQLLGNPKGTEEGVVFHFGGFNGSIAYGLIPYKSVPHPLPVFRFQVPVVGGQVKINIKEAFKYPYDFTGWQKQAQLTIGYRLIDSKGVIIFDGVTSLTGTGPFKVAPAIYEGPFVNSVTENGATISFETTEPVKAVVNVNGKDFEDPSSGTHHEIALSGLEPGKEYSYTLKYGELIQEYHFKTSPKKGSRKPFVFAYTSDSRHATGGGERMIYGANAYIMKKMAAVAYQQKAAFVQFTGDMINGYLSNKEEQHVQLTNWKKSIEPFWHYMPFYVGQGNHEALGYILKTLRGNKKHSLINFLMHRPPLKQ